MHRSFTNTVSAPKQPMGVPSVEPESVPLVTVIMPVRNEEQFLPRCMDSLLANDYPHERLEVLVADGMSSDCSREILAGYSQRFPFVRAFDNPGRIAPTGLNAAIRQAQGEFTNWQPGGSWKNSRLALRTTAHAIVPRSAPQIRYLATFQ